MYQERRIKEAIVEYGESKINFDKLGGIVPVVVQDATNREVLMVAFMNEEAWQRTTESGTMWYYSRKRKVLWQKGEQSGHMQRVRSIYIDCDNDTILALVDQIGGACDLGYRSCFDKLWKGGHFSDVGVPVFDPAKKYPQYDENLHIAIPQGSLSSSTMRLLELGFSVQQGCRNEPVHTVLPSHSSPVAFVPHNSKSIPSLVASGECDAGITGFDLVLESQNSLVPICALPFNKLGRGAVTWALAVPESSAVRRLHDLAGSPVVTGLPHVTSLFLRYNGVHAQVIEYDGTHEDLFSGSAVVDLIESGATLKRYGYRPVVPVLATHAALVANPRSYGSTWKRRRLEELEGILSEAALRLPQCHKHIFKFPVELDTALVGAPDWESYRNSWFRYDWEDERT